MDLHTIALADYPDVTIKQCAVGICRCIMSVRKKKEVTNSDGSISICSICLNQYNNSTAPSLAELVSE
jgi:hypothetical protein